MADLIAESVRLRKARQGRRLDLPIHPAATASGAAAPAREVPQDGPMRDGFGRRIEYLRISVTDKCNLRCVYCMPEEGLPWLKREQLLSYEEIVEIVRVMAAMGLRRLRLTGGEPLVRRDLPTLVRQLRRIDGIEDLALSTNAVLLAPLAAELAEAGVDRVNISLDSLRAERVDAIARRPGSYRRIMEGLESAERVGFHPIKINTVVLRGRNDDELADFAAITRERPWHIRFIEVMPTGENLSVSANEYISAYDMLKRVRRIGELEPVEGPDGNGPATYFRFPDAPGTVGVITPMSHNYCDRCNRMRLTADGQLRPCLFGDIQTNLRDPLRRGEPLEPLVRHTLAIKPERHHLVQGSAQGSGGLLALSQVGG
jgi:GTP 3',8-cyclase